MKFKYETNCVDCGDGGAIQEMADEEIRIKYDTMRKRCDGLMGWAKSHGYVVSGDGLKLKDDCLVGFYRSNFKGRPCYFIRRSGIEFIWTEKGQA